MRARQATFNTKEELVKGVERLKGTAKGIDLAAFIAEYRRLLGTEVSGGVSLMLNRFIDFVFLK